MFPTSYKGTPLQADSDAGRYIFFKIEHRDYVKKNPHWLGSQNYAIDPAEVDPVALVNYLSRAHSAALLELQPGEKLTEILVSRKTIENLREHWAKEGLFAKVAKETK